MAKTKIELKNKDIIEKGMIISMSDDPLGVIKIKKVWNKIYKYYQDPIQISTSYADFKKDMKAVTNKQSSEEKQRKIQNESKRALLVMNHPHYCFNCKKDVLYHHALEHSWIKKRFKEDVFQYLTDLTKAKNKRIEEQFEIFEREFIKMWIDNRIQFLCCDCYALAKSLGIKRRYEIDNLSRIIKRLNKYGFDTAELEHQEKQYKKQLENRELPEFMDLVPMNVEKIEVENKNE